MDQILLNSERKIKRHWNQSNITHSTMGMIARDDTDDLMMSDGGFETVTAGNILEETTETNEVDVTLRKQSMDSMYGHEHEQIENQETMRESVTTQGPTDDGNGAVVETDGGHIGPISDAAMKLFDGNGNDALPETANVTNLM